MRLFAKLMVCGSVLCVGLVCMSAAAEDTARDYATALSLVKAQDYEASIPYFQKHLARHPDDAEAHTAVALAFGKLQRTDEALAHLRTATAIDPDEPAAQYALALLLEKVDRYEDAIETWRRVIELTTDPHLKKVAQKHIHLLEKMR